MPLHLTYIQHYTAPTVCRPAHLHAAEADQVVADHVLRSQPPAVLRRAASRHLHLQPAMQWQEQPGICSGWHSGLIPVHDTNITATGIDYDYRAAIRQLYMVPVRASSATLLKPQLLLLLLLLLTGRPCSRSVSASSTASCRSLSASAWRSRPNSRCRSFDCAAASRSCTGTSRQHA